MRRESTRTWKLKIVKVVAVFDEDPTNLVHSKQGNAKTGLPFGTKTFEFEFE